MNRMRVWLRRWLGVEADKETLTATLAEQRKDLVRALNVISTQVSKQTEIGIDLDPRFGDQSYVVVVSRLNGGQVRIVPVRFRDMREMHEYATRLKDQFGGDARVTCDTPAGAFRGFVEESARGLRRSSIWE